MGGEDSKISKVLRKLLSSNFVQEALEKLQYLQRKPHQC